MGTKRMIQRGTAVLLFISAIGAVAAGVALPVTRYLTDREALIEQRETQIVTLTRRATGIGQLREQLNDATLARSSHPALMPETSVTLAAAALRERLKTGVEAVGGELQTTQVLAAGNRGPFRTVILAARISVDTVGLRELLYRMETKSPSLSIDELTIKGGGQARELRDRLDVRIQVMALIDAEETT